MARIGTAISLNQIPQEYKDLPFLGRGFSSVVYQRGDKALVLTRDKIKVGWAQEHLNGIVEHDFDTTKNRVPAYDDFPVFVVECDLMSPLTKENKSIVRKAMRVYQETRVSIIDKNRPNHPSDEQVVDETFERIAQRQDTISDMMAPIISFMRDWDCYGVDFLKMDNWMQTSSGEIKCIDPLVDNDLISVARKKFHEKHYKPKEPVTPKASPAPSL